MKKRIAINGFGRIGRLTLRALFERSELQEHLEIVAINDLFPASELAYLLQYDSVHGQPDFEVLAVNESTLSINNQEIKVTHEKKHPQELDWKPFGIDAVIESTGLFAKKKDAQGHITAGAEKVIISQPSDVEVPMYVMGVNHQKYQGEAIVSNASCTTNCLAPLVHALQKSGIGIKKGLMTTIHAYTASQELVDGPGGKDPRRGRAAAENVVPTSTGAADAIGQIISEVDGKLTGMAYRVPVPTVSLVDLTFIPEKSTSLDSIKEAMHTASESYLQGILDVSPAPLVSSDFVHNQYASTFDPFASIQLDENFFKIASWYDNEWGYANRLIELVAHITSV